MPRAGKSSFLRTGRSTKTLLRKLAAVYDHIEIDPSPIRNKILEIIKALSKVDLESLTLTVSGVLTRLRAAMKLTPALSKRSKSLSRKAETLRR